MKTATSKNGITEVLSTPEHKGGNPKKARGGGAATSGLTFRGVR